MSEMTAGPVPGRIRNRTVLLFVGVVLLLAALAGGALVIRNRIAAASPLQHPTHAVDPQVIEDQWGLRITQVAVTADGGMIDLRYLVTDPDKAIVMAHDITKMPVLLSGDGRSLINSASLMSEKHDLRAGTVYFILYRNQGGAIKTGSKVSVIFGDERLDGQPVR